MTTIVTTVTDWRQIRSTFSESVGLVPTMGNLHAGHLSLLKRAKDENATTVASIFVNYTQFNDEDDFKCYPKTIEADLDKLQTLDVDYVFLPTVTEMYPDQYEIKLQETVLATVLEGACRPGHFDGMLTVVLKLFNIIHPTRAYFGEKDYQQLLLIKKMVKNFFLPVEIITCETIRLSTSLPLSSRNSRLSESQYEQAALFSQLLASSHTCSEIEKLLQTSGMQIDYITEKWGRRLGAVWIDRIRLIDNIAR